MAAVFAFGKRGANNRAPVSNYLISKGFDFDGVKVGLRMQRLDALPGRLPGMSDGDVSEWLEFWFPTSMAFTAGACALS